MLLWDTRSTSVESFHTDAGPLYAHTFYDEHMLLTGGEVGCEKMYYMYNMTPFAKTVGWSTSVL